MESPQSYKDIQICISNDAYFASAFWQGKISEKMRQQPGFRSAAEDAPASKEDSPGGLPIPRPQNMPIEIAGPAAPGGGYILDRLAEGQTAVRARQQLPADAVSGRH